jgi:putative hemolysin
MPLSFLHHYARAGSLARAGAARALCRDDPDIEGSDRSKASARALPPLIKGYLRLGAYIGDGAVVDHEFGTTDVLIVLPVSAIKKRYIEHFAVSQRAASLTTFVVTRPRLGGFRPSSG